MRIAVLGGGTFGTAIANALKKEHEILLFSRNKYDILEINRSRRNPRYFPNKVLSKQIYATNEMVELSSARIIFICIPSYAVVDFFTNIELDQKAVIVNGAKGFGKAGKLIPQILFDLLPNTICSIKGPSFADELIYELPTAFTIASEKRKEAELLSSLFREDMIIFDYSDDIRGIEMLGILKNIYAIIIGIVDASFNSANVRFMLLTKAVNEIKTIIEKLSIPLETIFKYAGIGDLALTALNDLSRNRTFGLLIGKGFFYGGVKNKVVLEGVRSVDYILDLLPKDEYKSFSLLFTLSKLLNGEISINEFVKKTIFD